jgi:hypothetical protein
MPNIADLLSSQLPDPDPSDQLRDPLGQGQNLTGLSPQPGQGAAPPPQMTGGPPGMAPSANVPGPLAALAPAPVAGKPRIRLKTPPAKKIKPRIKLKASAYGRAL